MKILEQEDFEKLSDVDQEIYVRRYRAVSQQIWYKDKIFIHNMKRGKERAWKSSMDEFLASSKRYADKYAKRKDKGIGERNQGALSNIIAGLSRARGEFFPVLILGLVMSVFVWNWYKVNYNDNGYQEMYTVYIAAVASDNTAYNPDYARALELMEQQKEEDKKMPPYVIAAGIATTIIIIIAIIGFTRKKKDDKIVVVVANSGTE